MEKRNLFCEFCPASNPGTRIKKELVPRVDEKGRLTLEVGGDYNTDAFIQSWKDSTDMAYILSRLAAGDKSVLGQSSAVYGDLTVAPKTLAEALQLRIDANNAFDRLPDDVKLKFDNDPSEFFRLSGSAEWMEKLGYVRQEPVVSTDNESEVTE